MSTEDTSFLRQMGWSPFHDSWFQTYSNKGLLPGRIIGEEKGIYRIQVSLKQVLLGEVRGKFRHEANSREDFPAVGDWVLYHHLPQMDRARIEVLLQRRTCLIRKQAGLVSERQILAANVDMAFIVTSANDDFNLKRLQRYLTLVWDSGAKPVVLISKCELVEDVQNLADQVTTLSPGLDVHCVSAATGAGLESVVKYLTPGTTLILLGSSGVGKSTLVNLLMGRTVMNTKEIRESDERGRHITTGRHLFQLPGGALLIDTPGMRELQLMDHDEGLHTVFDDIEAWMSRCRFVDCQHLTEPGCALKAALLSGDLDDARLQDYLKLKREIAFQQRKENITDKLEAKSRWKKIHRQAKQHSQQKKSWGK
jgi:ribosome biogenesis GTPase